MMRKDRISAWASWACAEVATFPVPMAQTGSYAITIFLQKVQPSRRMCPAKRLLPVCLFEELDDRLELVLDDLGSLVRLALSEGLADAKDHGEAVIKRDAGLFCDELRRLMEEGAALRVAFQRK